MKKKLLAVVAVAAMLATMIPSLAFAVSVDVSKGYDGQALPAGPSKSGDVWTVTPENAQYTLDGAYGSIDGITIHFGPGVYSETLELARATKYPGSNTVYYNDGNWDATKEPVTLENLTEGGVKTYFRTVQNVTFTAADGVKLKGFTASSGHYYGANGESIYDYVREVNVPDTNNSFYLYNQAKGITFQGLTITENIRFNSYISGDQCVAEGITFDGCTFEGDKAKMGDSSFAAIKANSDIHHYKNFRIVNCSITDYFQGVFIQGIDGLEVKNNSIIGTTHNAVAMQSSKIDDKDNDIRGKISIQENYIKEIKDRAFRINILDNGASIAINNNIILESGDENGEVLKAENVTSGTLDLEYNYWGDGKSVETAVNTKGGVSRPTETGIVRGTFANVAVNEEYLNPEAGDWVSVNEVNYIGKEAVEEGLKNVKATDRVGVYRDADGKIEVPAGTKVVNYTKSDLEINGVNYTYGQSADGITAPEKQPASDQPKPEIKPEASPVTGDDSNMTIPIVIAALALAGMAAVAVTRRRRG